MTRPLLRLQPSRKFVHTQIRRPYSSGKVIQEYDVILLRQHNRPGSPPKFFLTPPLRADKTITLSFGTTIRCADLIGRQIQDVVSDSKGRHIHLREASLAAYIINAKRETTPIYPQDASLIISLLNLNLPVPGEDPGADAAPPVEIFEAGTGVGSLTLHLAHAVHGANPPVPPDLRKALCSAPYTEAQGTRSEDSEKAETHAQDFASPDTQALYANYLCSRRAIVHTLDTNRKTSRAAHTLIRNFRRAQYLLDVSFHVTTIDRYLTGRLAANGGQPFLSHAILDLPDTHHYIGIVKRALHQDGTLAIFCPSITQIADFVRCVKDSSSHLLLERVVELPTATMSMDGVRYGACGRDWNVQVVARRAGKKDEDDGTESEGANAAELKQSAVVCRPKVGTMVTGGGFVAVFRRMADRPPDGVEVITE